MRHMDIVGAGGLGRELLSLLRRDAAHGRDWLVVGFIDTRIEMKGQIIAGIPVVGGVDDAPTHQMAIYCSAIGDTEVRKKIVQSLIAKGAIFVQTRTSCEIGDGAQLGASMMQLNATISTDARVGSHVYLDSGCVIGHDACIHDYVHIGRNAFIGGKAVIEEGVIVNSCSSISQGVRVGAWATIGLGAVVLRDVPAGALMIGNPARNVKN